MPKVCFCLDCGKKCFGVRCRKCQLKDLRSNSTFDKIEWRRKKLYGMFPGQFDLMWNDQNGLCKICSKSMSSPSKGQGQGLDVVAIDHCHTNGNVRGLLCNGCNKALGFFNDDIELLNKAIVYLKENNINES